ncbi:LamG domain-containing protein [Haloferula sp. A504]|uniref:LamG domain-containing protein n=1 Tax=Haloferula sp. A504 TaxID=3373601 RepID=UPI0031C01F3E|nr:LamG domain-containing protein [Verrucomicrobiaceae bacterium E54]
MSLLLSSAFGGAAEKDLPPHAHEHVAGTAYVGAPQPEVNPWASRGIPSRYDFAAYYTRKHYEGEKWHEISRTGEYTDVVVRLGESPREVVFGRVSSYHPEVLVDGEVVAAFPERTERRGDGPGRRPDKVNRYARARLIETNDNRVVIHYRYMPQMPAAEQMRRLNPPDQTGFIDEYFVFYPDGSGVRALRPGSPRMEAWYDADRLQVFRFQISAEGAVEEELAFADDRRMMLDVLGFRIAPHRASAPAPLLERSRTIPQPMLEWNFDEGAGRTTREAVSGRVSQVEGHAALWRRGVSGNALLFDGYTNRIQHSPSRSIQSEQLTLSAWVCIAAYPWNDCSIIQQGDVLADGDGISLGIDPHGRPLLALSTTDGRVTVRKEDAAFRIPRYQWTLLTGIIDRKEGIARLYLNGLAVDERSLRGRRIRWAAGQPVKIGEGPPLEAAWPVGRVHGPYPYGFEGLIDEVCVHGQAIAPDPELPARLQKEMPDMERRILPAGEESWKNFGARYTRLGYHEAWDSMFRMSGHPDVVVTFDKVPGRYVFWHGANYIPMMVNEKGHWYSNQFNETWWNGGFEPMGDKRMVYGRVHIVEQSPARVVIRWRYPLSGVDYRIFAEGWADDSGWGEWCDWYFTIYPDGSCVKRMRSWKSRTHGREWHESMVILGPDQHPESVIESRPTLTLGTLDGTIRRYNWIEEPPTDVNYEDVSLHIVNLQAEYDPYTICGPVNRGNVYTKRGDNPYGVFPAWNHWPVGQFPSPGRYVRYPDRSAHCSMTHLYWDPSVAFEEEGRFEEKLMLEGLSNASPERLVEIARSYLKPPAAVVEGGQVSVEWDEKTRAYQVTRESGEVREMELRLEASEAHPSVNPVFVVENWGEDHEANLLINGKLPPNDVDIRQGVVRRPNGVTALVIWMEMACREPTDFQILNN